tara:strand:- start:343 stop:1023 length:681 start_codon:yes stop_codon:yes gene_type:complete
MKKYIYFLLFIIFAAELQAHTDHYKGIVKIEMDVLRNGEIVGYSNYFFEYNDNTTVVKNYTKFKVKILGATLFSILSEAIETYESGKLVKFKSNTFQNKKEKFVNLNYNNKTNKFDIHGSSYKGEAEVDNVIGNWWNHEIIDANKQISPLSGSIKEQVVKFIGEESLTINNIKYNANHYKLKSKDKNLPNDKKLNFDIWYDVEKKIILKVSYSRLGDWEYRLKGFE